jgi:two-component system, response regulator PdtaR
MIYQDAQLARQLTPHLNRVLILDGGGASVRLLGELLRDLGAGRIETYPNNALALTTLKAFDPQVVFTELSDNGLDGLEFTRALRRSDLPCRKAPVILITSESTTAAILASRHAGVHEFLRKPYSIKDLMRRLDAAILRHRDWIEAVSYIGPDRRRFNSGDYVGPRKRESDVPQATDGERMIQALKILRAVIPAVEQDPVQALRAMRAQADELSRVAQARSDLKLTTAVGSLQRCLASAAATGRLWRPDIEAASQGLWSYLPADADKKAALQVV